MSAIRVLLLVGLLIAGPLGARAADDAWGEPPWPADVGLQLGLDAPAGAVAALTFRPFVPWARLHGGLTWNYFAFGLQGGATVMPWPGRVTPTASFEIGRTFDADLRSPLSGLSVPALLRPSLASAGYSYASGLVGLELGDPRGSVFFVRAGLTHVWSTLAGIDRYPARSGTVSTSPLHLTAWAPAVSVGAAFRLW